MKRPLDEDLVELICDGDEGAWEDANLLLPDRFMYSVGEVLDWHSSVEATERG